MKKKDFLLTKSKLVPALFCNKFIFLKAYKNEHSVADCSTIVSELGIEFGELAHTLFPGGYLVKTKDPDDSLVETKKNFKKGNIIFEAAFKIKNLFCRVDILEVIDNNKVIINEVKSSTWKNNIDSIFKNKTYIQDIAIQRYILESCGLEVIKTNLILVNPEYTLDKKKSELFAVIDVTEKSKVILPEIEIRIEEIKRVLLSEKEPSAKLGPHCNKIECPFKPYCHKEKKLETPNILDVTYYKDRYLVANKKRNKISDISRSGLSAGVLNQIKKLSVKRLSINKKNIKNEFNKWGKDLFFLDFEAYSSPIPKINKIKPYEPVPYQFSCYKLVDGNIIKVFSFLSKEHSDMNIEIFIKKLLEVLDGKEKIVVYSAGYEKHILKNISNLIPRYSGYINNIINRIVDLREIIQNNVSHPNFFGKTTIKAVAPALLGEKSSYKDLDISNGLDSVSVYLNAIKNDELEKHEKSLIEYCDKDVLEMIKIYQFLKVRL